MVNKNADRQIIFTRTGHPVVPFTVPAVLNVQNRIKAHHKGSEADEEEEEEEDVFVFNDTIEGPRAPAAEPRLPSSPILLDPT